MTFWLALALLIGILALAVWGGTYRERRALSALIDDLAGAESLGTESLGEGGQAGVHESDSLPAPVARYLEWALPRRQPIRRLFLRQTGVLRTDPRSQRWMSFEAEQRVNPRSIGFVWNARVAIAPFLHVRVRDAFVAGQGSGRVSLLSAFPVAADGGTAEMNAGSLHRYLAESVWYPSALLPSKKLKWSPIDENRALATLTEGARSVSLEFRFADTGEVTGIYTPARWGKFDGGYKEVPWEGHFSDYEEVQGMMVPMNGEVGWYFEGVWRLVWKGRVVSVEYQMLS